MLLRTLRRLIVTVRADAIRVDDFQFDWNVGVEALGVSDSGVTDYGVDGSCQGELRLQLFNESEYQRMLERLH